MPSIARTVRPSEQISAEIVQTFGFLPPFYEPALPIPQVLENLWQQTLLAYVDSPLPALFLERLNAYLSRFCVAPYCMISHSSALRPLGMTARQVLTLLETPPSLGADLEGHLEVLNTLPMPAADFPLPDSPREQALIACATAVFLGEDQADLCRERLSLVLGPGLFNSLILYLAYIETCHTWVEMHPEISYEADQRVKDNLGPLLMEEPALAEFFRDYREKVAAQRRRSEERRAADTALRTARSQTERLLESITDAFIVLDADWNFTYLNSEAERLLRRTQADLVGKSLWEEFPGGLGTSLERQDRLSAAARTAVSYEQYYPPLNAWFEIRAYPSPDGISVFFSNIDARKEAEEERRRLEVAQRTAGILESITDAFYALDTDWRFTYVNTQAEQQLGRTRKELLGKNLWEEFPPSVGSIFEGEYRRAVREQVTVTFEEFYAPLDLWVDVRAFPSPEGLSVFFQNVNARKEAEAAGRQREALRESEQRYRLIVDAIPHIAWTAGPDWAINYYNRRWYDYSGLTFEETQAVGWRDFIHPDDQVHAAAVWKAADSAGTASEVEYRLRQWDGNYRLHLGRSVPVVEQGEIIQWVGTATDIEDHRAAEAALHKANQRTTGILESITDAFYALDTEWHFTYINPQAELLLRRTREDLLGKNIWQEFPEAIGTRPYLLYHRAAAEGMLIAFEEYYAPLTTWFDVRVYPGLDGLSIYFQNVSERKALEDKMELLAERERNIAMQLQAALTPALPENIPGLSVTKYYEAALDEAWVGGDFYDVFPVEDGCTALVVGDLSGKGLAAAAQVATVRNMVRYAVFRSRTLAGALTNLNAVLVEQGLLTGFATLFVGAYEDAEHTLTYVNCGQEPGLIRRAASGAVEQLLPTGPVLGAIKSTVYTEQKVMLSSGDVLALFTDGITECGVNRQQMLGIEGVEELLQPPFTSAEAASIVLLSEAATLRLVEGVEKASRGGVSKDDVCILVAVVE